MVNFAADEPTVDSRNMANKSKIDGYVQTQETPAYASSFLITGLLSPDYVDVKGDGITEDDLGSAVKFNYNKSSYTHKWRTPRNNTTANTAHLNEGIRTEKRDNKATISYGEREAWYLNSIESKSMVAIFKTDARDDAKGVNGEMDGRVNANENANKKLIRIDLYTKSEIKTKGITNARPIKTVNFEYDYSLCNGAPDNKNGNGKLTLKSVYFTYNGQLRQKKDRYVFNYGNTASQVDNPSYSYNASDRWGTYKPKIDPISSTANNPSGLSNIDFPYTLNDKSKCDKYASAWSLKKILLPSGGQMEMQYESGDYAYVQNRRACNMYSIYGLGKTTNYVNNSNMFNSGLSSIDNNYVYIKLLEPLVSTNSTDLKSEIFSKYLEDMTQPGGKKQLAFKLQVNYPKGPEPLTVYAEYDDYGLCSNAGSSKDYIFIHLKDVDGKSPLAKSAIGFLTENIPGQAFDGYNVEVDGLEAFITMAGGMLSSLKNAFRNVDEQMRNAPKGRSIDLAKSFIRLANPSKIKYGSGVRVKKIIVRDNWNKMSDQYNSVYGQEYDYKTTEKINGIEKSISSGVASYEPGIGSEENPFREIISFNNKMPLASAQYGAIEMPMLEGLYPCPNVVYSKVTVRSIHRKGTHGDLSLRSAIGKQVSEFYTAREFPSFSCYTPMDSKEYNKNPFFSFFYKEVINRRAITQGFLVETNDMHGKIKSQVAYSESDEKTALSASYHSYKNTGRNGLNDKVDFVYSNEGGTVRSGNMGVDMELMTDVREFSVMSKGFNGQLQVDLFTFAFAVIPLPTFFPLKTYVENKYRAVTCTKVINYHAIEDSVIVMDKGSVISTKTIAYDSETGAPIVSKTANEFNDPIYNTTYPSYWAYSGMGPAYKNVGVEYNNVTFYDGRITAGITDSSLFESGDELFIINGSGTSGCIGETPGTAKVWVLDKNKNSTALTVPVKDLVFIDQLGNMFTKNNVHFKIVRSGKRNNLGLTVSSVSSKKSPIQNISSEYRLVLDSTSKVVATSAVEYKEKWQTDNDAFLRRAYYADSCTGIETDSLSCNGILEKNINPYIKGLIGNYKPYRSYTYYGERKESNANSTTSIRNDGYISGYGNYWFFNNDYNLVPDVTNTKWVWNNELTKINSKGQELETKDALNRYTAAQYGYAKNMPVAMVQNSRYGESFYEGFEDYGYQENINSLSNTNCINKYINYSGIQNSSIINTDSITGSAHTGKTSLLVNANSEVVKTLQVDTSNYTNFNFEFPNENVSNFYLGPTGSHQKLTSTPYYPGAIYDFDYYNLGMSYEIKKNSVSGIPLFSYNSSANTSTFYSYYKTTQTIKITNAATHVFYLNAIQGDGSYWQTGCYFNRATIDLKIKDVTGQEVFATMLYSDAGQSVTDMFTSASKTDSTFLNCGIYTVECLVTADLGMNGYFTTLHTFISKCSYFSSPQVVTGSFTSCAHNVPIPAKDSMLNPINFKLIPEKRMQFSAWVKEDCSVPCYKTDYDKSKIEIKSNGNVIGNLKRSGAIIEGRQKIEGEFTIPYGSTSAQMVFTNTNNMPMFIDDIRIHPFNANMKSYVFDSRTLRLSAELDENNYSSIYEYDEEGQLVRVKKETIQGIKTIKETRSAKQKIITDLQ